MTPHTDYSVPIPSPEKILCLHMLTRFLDNEESLGLRPGCYPQGQSRDYPGLLVVQQHNTRVPNQLCNLCLRLTNTSSTGYPIFFKANTRFTVRYRPNTFGLPKR